MEQIIKSKKRVKEHAEVFTPSFIVKNMTKLCEPDISNIHKRVLEPSCGNGAFLTHILKLRLKKCQNDYNRLIALSNLYGVDIQPDNVEECRQNLRDVAIGDGKPLDFIIAVEQILHTNIVCGDTIHKPEDITFTSYEPLGGGKFATSEHNLKELSASNLTER